MKPLHFIRLTDVIAGHSPSVPPKTIKVALLPSEEVSLLHTSLPMTSAHKLKKAAPFAIEDKLIDDLESLHFSFSKQEKTGTVALAAVKKTVLRAWYEVLIEKGIVPKIMIPEVLALTFQAGSWHIFLVENKALVRLGRHAGLAIGLPHLSQILPLLLKEQVMPTVIHLSYTAEHAEYSLDFPSALTVPIVKAPLATTPELEFAQGLAQEVNALNLLDGADCLKSIKNQQSYLNHPHKGWLKYVAFGVAAFWLVSQIGSLMIFKARNHAVEMQIQGLYNTIFSVDTPFNAVSKRLNQQLETVYDISSGPFLNMMIDLGNELKKHNGTIVIHSLTWKNNTLVLQVTAPELRTLQKVGEALGKQKNIVGDGLGTQQYAVQIEAVQPSADHITAQLQMRVSS